MTHRTPQVWSPTMRIMFWFFIAGGAAVCIGSIVWVIAGPAAGGREAGRMLMQIVGSAAWTVFLFAFKGHPEWLREKW
jgi:hypothetical protein